MGYFTLLMEEWCTEIEINDWRQLSFYVAFIHNGYWSTINNFVAPFIQSTYFNYGTVNNTADLNKLTPIWMGSLAFVTLRVLKINTGNQFTDWLFVNKICGLLSTLGDNVKSNETRVNRKTTFSWNRASD